MRCALPLWRSGREICQHNDNCLVGLPYNVGRFIDEACSVIADIDIMGYSPGIGGGRGVPARGGGRSE